MKYKICRTIHRELKIVSNKDNSRITELKEKTLYFAKRKGKIFGFWHDVGEETCDYNGGTFISTEYFSNPEDCEEYVKKFHVYHYGNKEKIEIYKEFDIEKWQLHKNFLQKLLDQILSKM
jgi:hypothetical protein